MDGICQQQGWNLTIHSHENSSNRSCNRHRVGTAWYHRHRRAIRACRRPRSMHRLFVIPTTRVSVVARTTTARRTPNRLPDLHLSLATVPIPMVLIQMCRRTYFLGHTWEEREEEGAWEEQALEEAWEVRHSSRRSSGRSHRRTWVRVHSIIILRTRVHSTMQMQRRQCTIIRVVRATIIIDKRVTRVRRIAVPRPLRGCIPTTPTAIRTVRTTRTAHTVRTTITPTLHTTDPTTTILPEPPPPRHPPPPPSTPPPPDPPPKS